LVKRLGEGVILNGHPEQRLPNTLHVNCLLPTSVRESRFSLAYSYPYKRHPMTWRQS
jgi:hypothetical protein